MGQDVERDVVWQVVQMPCGMVIPQLVKGEHYKYLGTEMPPGWFGGKAQGAAEEKVLRKCKTLLWMLGGIPALTDAHLGQAMSLAVAGVIGFYGRSTVITWATCQRIEAVRAAVLRAKQRAPGTPRLQIFASYEEGGMGTHQHAYVYAAAAIVDQFDRNLCAPEGTPGRLAVEAAIAQTCTKLGCRQHPLRWEAGHLRGVLRDDLLVEAWLAAKDRLRIRSVVTAYGEQAAGPM